MKEVQEARRIKMLHQPSKGLDPSYLPCFSTRETCKENTKSQETLVGQDGAMTKEPIRLLNRRLVKRKSHAITKVLVEWANTFPENSTWEVLRDLQVKFPN
ncbi:hypothetical protein PVK06_026832 [Gossypium arboreum]|uniref:Stomatal closure-related actin-binding protein coiled-coil domain-containing protein n=1 Tax=Gossypium arboreum TaxID=29729 RepID=A0ABR0P000_GOSAR|nr:hypothetical protein PVK06_026832 [Gossypium arboreum]